MKLQGRIKVGIKTKELIHFLLKGDIAVIQHDDIDELAAIALVDANVKAIINVGKSMTGRIPAAGARIILQNNIGLIDVSLPIDNFKDNDIVTILNKDIIIRNFIYKNVCTAVNWDYINKRLISAKDNENKEILKFIDNTIGYAAIEADKILSFKDYPELNTKLRGRYVMVVVRNSSALEEMNMLRYCIERYNPVFIGVDGGADILIKCGYTPDILIGDMDSISPIGIYKSKELVLHTYEDGRCPCLDKIAAMNVQYKMLSIRGTSEDAALLLAYNKGAELIVLVGGHNCMYDFMSKGRAGMASTFIARTLIGGILIDCKGLNMITASENEGKEDQWAKI